MDAVDEKLDSSSNSANKVSNTNTSGRAPSASKAMTIDEYTSAQRKDEPELDYSPHTTNPL